ncbi:hypothetical protein NDU88_000135 [Pleurodeles waltl]|uniref:Uncharacterized protein n=1 Tax=Pleurodeles waltl TaxID=8319 RepID=A0AAV7S3Q5_PLEWA|nr:hypothetical protein NDU88_000135 [Pleurodeles waltl]
MPQPRPPPRSPHWTIPVGGGFQHQVEAPRLAQQLHGLNNPPVHAPSSHDPCKGLRHKRRNRLTPESNMAEPKDSTTKERESKTAPKRTKHSPPTLESPVKENTDTFSTLDTILRKRNTVREVAESTKTNTNLLQVAVAAIHSILKDLKIRVTAAESRISRVEDCTNEHSQKFSELENMVETRKSQIT